MNDRAIETLTRRAALAALSAAGIAAPTSSVAVAKAKNKGKKRKNNVDKKAKRKCKRQVEECTAFNEGVCEGDPECLEVSLRCCEFAGSCDLNGMLNCFLA